MKKLIPLFLTIVLFAACEKDPDLDKVHDQFVVYTQYDTKADFSSFSTFYIPDSVLVITGDTTKQYLPTDQGDEIIDAFVTNMKSKGYTRSTDKSSADLGIQVSYVKSTYYFSNYDYWWGSYPGYWGASYWGSWGGWYYPFPSMYSFTTGSLLAEMVDLNSGSTSSSTTTTQTDTTTGTSSTSSTSSKKLTVVWNDYITGLLSGSSNLNLSRIVTAIDQSFEQSTYLKK